MINTMTSESAEETLTDQPTAPWLELDVQEPGLHLTHQGVEMTSAWSFPVGSTLSVGISCQGHHPPHHHSMDDLADVPGAAPVSVLYSDPELDPQAEQHPNPAAATPANPQQVHATGLVVSCEPSAETAGNYQLTIYFLDHLSQLLVAEQEEPGTPESDLAPPLPLGVLPFFLGA